MRELVEKGVDRSARWISFPRKRAPSFPAKIKLVERREEPGSGKRSTISATKSTSARSSRSGPIPQPARSFAKSGPTTSCANARASEWKQTFRVGRARCAKKRSRARQAIQLVEQGQDRADQGIHLEERPAVRCLSRSAGREDRAGNFRRANREDADKDGKTGRAQSAGAGRSLESAKSRRKQNARRRTGRNGRRLLRAQSPTRTIARCLQADEETLRTRNHAGRSEGIAREGQDRR